MNKTEFIVVYEDIWNNKVAYQTYRIGDTVLEMAEEFGLTIEDDIDIEKLNSDDPYQLTMFGRGIFDIMVTDENEENDGIGRFMIFEVRK